jgi:hypothetical protein
MQTGRQGAIGAVFCPSENCFLTYIAQKPLPSGHTHAPLLLPRRAHCYTVILLLLPPMITVTLPIVCDDDGPVLVRLGVAEEPVPRPPLLDFLEEYPSLFAAEVLPRLYPAHLAVLAQVATPCLKPDFARLRAGHYTGAKAEPWCLLILADTSLSLSRRWRSPSWRRWRRGRTPACHARERQLGCRSSSRTSWGP